MLVTAPAKINLNLHVTGKRADGYHLLESLAVFTEFGDTLQFHPADALSLEVTGPFAQSLSAQDNLVLRAARLLQAQAGVRAGARIVLTKHIPVGAGLGGGSSDAAAALRSLAAFWELSITRETMRTLAVQLGSDVWICYDAAPGWITGAGDETLPVTWETKGWLLLVNPGKPLLTGDVFRAFMGPFSAPMELPERFDALGPVLEMRNDLEAPAIQLMPEIASMLGAIRATKGCRLARMSGSGATCYGLYDTRVQAEAAVAALQPGWWNVVTSLREI